MHAVIARLTLLTLLAGCGFTDKDREIPPDLDLRADGHLTPDAPTDLPVDAPADGSLDMGSMCGDGICDPGENATDCAQDCGCAAGTPNSCGGEAPFGCQCDVCCFDFGDCCDDADTVCGVIGTACGNGACDSDCEDNFSCAADCP